MYIKSCILTEPPGGSGAQSDYLILHIATVETAILGFNSILTHLHIAQRCFVMDETLWTLFLYHTVASVNFNAHAKHFPRQLFLFCHIKSWCGLFFSTL